MTLGYIFQQKCFTAVSGICMGAVFFSLHIFIDTEPLCINNCFFLRRPPPLCSSSSRCSLEIGSKDPRVSGNRPDLFFTLKQKGDWERHSVRTCSSVEKDLLLMHTHPISPHCYLKLNTSGFWEHTGRGLLCSPVIAAWGPQSQVLWERGSRATAAAHIRANCKRGQWQGRQMTF